MGMGGDGWGWLEVERAHRRGVEGDGADGYMTGADGCREGAEGVQGCRGTEGGCGGVSGGMCVAGDAAGATSSSTRGMSKPLMRMSSHDSSGIPKDGVHLVTFVEVGKECGTRGDTRGL